MARGTEVPPAEPPLDIPRKAGSWEIYLRLGSDQGVYDVRIASPDGEALVSASGAARVKAGVASLRVQANLSSLRAGLYVFQIHVFQIRRPNSNLEFLFLTEFTVLRKCLAGRKIVQYPWFGESVSIRETAV